MGDLSADEERSLVRRAQRGCQHSRDRLIDTLQPIINGYARRYTKLNWSHAPDLHQAGIIAALEALDRLDPDLGRLAAYARFGIRNAIRAEAHRLHTIASGYDHRRAQFNGRFASLNRPMDGEGGEEAIDYLPDPNPIDLETAVEWSRVMDAVDALPELEREVMHARLAEEPLRPIACRMGRSIQGIGDIERRAHRMLREALLGPETGRVRQEGPPRLPAPGVPGNPAAAAAVA